MKTICQLHWEDIYREEGGEKRRKMEMQLVPGFLATHIYTQWMQENFQHFPFFVGRTLAQGLHAD